MRPVIINADDYAMDAGVDAAILKLAAKGAITAASAMVLAPRWPEAARAARDAPFLSWGLHLDLTSHFIDSPFRGQNLLGLIARAQARLLDPVMLRRVVERQLTLFEANRGEPPDFVDGHQHVHHLPLVRDVLIEAIGARYGDGKKRIGVRICAAGRWRGTKAAIIAGTGAARLARLAAARGYAVNSDFAGVYDFGAGAGLPALWEGWISSLRGPLPLVMCHVAVRDVIDSDDDPIRKARYREFDWLASDRFLELSKRLGIRPAYWPRA
jgi:chitin disaccharide deacetylase